MFVFVLVTKEFHVFIIEKETPEENIIKQKKERKGDFSNLSE